jgi:putative restriction endonuclease
MSGRAFVAVTDTSWFEFLTKLDSVDEVNFWQPGGGRNFRALDLGQPLLFKLRYPVNAIVGGGFFAHFSRMPVSLAWEAFGEKNGTRSFAAMRESIVRLRRGVDDPRGDYDIGCIILAEPFFLSREHWVPAPPDFAANTVVGKSYDLSAGLGRELWEKVVMARALEARRVADAHTGPVYGEPTLHTPRLGQGAFRVLVTDAYRRHCAITGEKTLPVLEAAHIRPVSAGGQHRVDNGLLLRSDIHTLFDRGYVTVTPDYRFRVSPKLRADWSNGRVYYELDGADISRSLPAEAGRRPAKSALEWHADTSFRS